jgi:hypothetical protein
MPLGRPDPQTGMHIVKRSTRNHRRNAEIVSIRDLVLGCHLMAKSTNPIDKSLSTHNILDKADQFYINPYIHVDNLHHEQVMYARSQLMNLRALQIEARDLPHKLQ